MERIYQCPDCEKTFKFPHSEVLKVEVRKNGLPSGNFERKIISFCPNCNFIINPFTDLISDFEDSPYKLINDLIIKNETNRNNKK